MADNRLGKALFGKLFAKRDAAMAAIGNLDGVPPATQAGMIPAPQIVPMNQDEFLEYSKKGFKSPTAPEPVMTPEGQIIFVPRGQKPAVGDPTSEIMRAYYAQKWAKDADFVPYFQQ